MGMDSSSIISNSAKIHPSVDIGPFCIIGDDVELGEGTSVLSHA
ncbi:MAG: acyl-[acyl-carrier-protein]--UDP-N-acetylglucosamine O-acyltransferase, partial [Nitrosomonadales bacterium]|nr:acyl-[acyl-carrier-protein]--UDP-N-acetylglucosamine O-acyltransferase [Nitrosomonadales bacterium]